MMTIQNTRESVEKISTTAAALAKKDIPVFPVLASKAPACPNGYKAASKAPDIVVALWQQYPAPLIGVSTGALSGIDALDIDPRHEGDKWLAEHAAKIPLTRVHQTRSGGWHYLFQHHEGLRNSAGKVARGVDIRADGGYIVWWPAGGFPVLNDIPVAPWPDWLLDLASPPPPPPRSRLSMRGMPVVKRFQDLKQAAHARAALRRAFQAVLTADEGTRNETLNSETWSLTRFVESGRLSAQDIANALAAAALAAGLDRREIISTVASALRARG